MFISHYKTDWMEECGVLLSENMIKGKKPTTQHLGISPIILFVVIEYFVSSSDLFNQNSNRMNITNPFIF